MLKTWNWIACLIWIAREICRVIGILWETLSDLCVSEKIMKVLMGDSNEFGSGISLETSTATKGKMKPSEQDKEDIFELAQSHTDLDELLNRLQKFDFDVNKETDCHGDNLIHIATKQGVHQIAMISLLVKVCHADINLTNRDGFTCLMLAAIMGCTTTVETLLSVFGAEPDVQHSVTSRTAIHYASQRNLTEIVGVLLKRGADCNLEDSSGARADELAVVYKASDAQALIKTQREVRMKHLASLVEQERLESTDIHHTDLYVTTSEGFTLIMLAAQLNSCTTLAWLVRQHGTPVDAQHSMSLMPALSLAAQWGHLEAVRILLRSGANPSICDKHGRNTLQVALAYHQDNVVHELLDYPQALIGLHKALRITKVPTLQKEIQSAIQRRQKAIVTPVVYECCVSGDGDRLYSVLEQGDNVNHCSGVGDWPMYIAAENGHLQVVDILHQFGGEVSRHHCQTGDTALHIACSQGHLEVTRYILDTCNQCETNRGKSALTGRNSAKDLVNAFNYKKETPLILAANRGCSDIVELLLSHGASSSVLNPYTGHLYQCAQYQGLQSTIEKHRKKHTAQVMAALTDWKALKQLKQVFLEPFDQNLRSCGGDTVLMVACRMGKADVVKYLLESVLYQVLPSPPSQLDVTRCFEDSDCDSGAVLSSPDAQKSPEASNLSKPHEKQEESVAATSSALTPSASFYIPPNTEEEEELSYHDNISSLLDSIASVSRGSVFTSRKHINHLCATSYRDGRTAYHRAIEGGDQAKIVRQLLDVDQSGVNVQDGQGFSPLHLACKLNRHNVLHALISVPFVDLNCRTLDGKLPEEMTTNKQIATLVSKSRRSQPIRSSFSRLPSIPQLLGITTADDIEESDSDSHTTASRFLLLKTDLAADVNMFL